MASGFDISNNIISGKVDNTSIEFDGSGNFTVKAGGVTTAKLASPTGTDTNVVTGTAGTSGNLSAWDANGDAVDSGYSVTNDDALGTSDATLPTQGNVKAYVKAYVDGGFIPSEYAGEQSVTLPNGMIMKFGQKTTGLPAAGVIGTVTYTTPFPNSTIYANYIGNSYSAGSTANNVITNPLAASFSFVHGYIAITTLFWFAIGY